MSRFVSALLTVLQLLFTALLTQFGICGLDIPFPIMGVCGDERSVLFSLVLLLIYYETESSGLNLNEDAIHE